MPDCVQSGSGRTPRPEGSSGCGRPPLGRDTGCVTVHVHVYAVRCEYVRRSPSAPEHEDSHHPRGEWPPRAAGAPPPVAHAPPLDPPGHRLPAGERGAARAHAVARAAPYSVGASPLLGGSAAAGHRLRTAPHPDGSASGRPPCSSASGVRRGSAKASRGREQQVGHSG